MTVTPVWVSVDLQLGWTQPGKVDTGRLASDGVTPIAPSIPIGTIARFRDTSSLALGMGTFIFLPGVTSTARGDVVSWRGSSGVGTSGDLNGGAATARWAGTANTGYPLAVATNDSTSQLQWGWYQLQGAAVINITGTITAGNASYFGQVGQLETAAAAGGKQVLGCQASSAAGGLLETTKAVFTINNPCVQSQIT